MMKKFYKANPVPGSRVFEKGTGDSLGSIGDVEDNISECKEEST